MKNLKTFKLFSDKETVNNVVNDVINSNKFDIKKYYQDIVDILKKYPGISDIKYNDTYKFDYISFIVYTPDEDEDENINNMYKEYYLYVLKIFETECFKWERKDGNDYGKYCYKIKTISQFKKAIDEWFENSDNWLCEDKNPDF